MRAFDPSKKSEAEVTAALELMSHLSVYERVGHDIRSMAFLADGSIGEGSGDCEAIWDVSSTAEGLVLSIGSEQRLTCRLMRTREKVWGGNWLIAEKMPIRLHPTKARPTECTFMDPTVRFVLNPHERFSWIRERYAYPQMLQYRNEVLEAGLLALLEDGRMEQLMALLLYSLTLPGDTIECGVYKGGTSAFIACAAGKVGKTHYACDSFTGLPGETEHDNIHKRGDFADTSFDAFNRGIAHLGLEQHTRVLQGWFTDTLPELIDKRFCFAHIDADLYESTMQCIEFIYPRISPSGWIVLDDYTWEHCHGVKTAVDKFFADKPETVVEIAGHVAAVQKQP